MPDDVYSYRQVVEAVDRAVERVKLDINANTTREMARLEGTQKAHEDNAWAHGAMRDRTQHTIEEWELWRDKVDKWRWGLAGVITFVGFEITAIGAVITVVSFFHH